MKRNFTAAKMDDIHSDIRGPLFYEAMAMEAAGQSVLKLNTGNPAAFGFKMPDSVLSALQGREPLGLGYCDFRGMPEGREAVAAYCRGKGIDGASAEDVFIGNGVSELATLSLQALLDPDDEVLLPTPCYSIWSNGVRLCGARPVYYTCDERANWYPDLADIRAHVTAKTKAIVIINPNNPCGSLYPAEILNGIADIAREHGLMILSDEIYDRLIFDGKKHISIASLTPDLPTVTLNGLSKSHCLCGLRVGWMLISGPKDKTAEYRNAIVKLTSLRLCSNTLGQLALPAAMTDEATPSGMVAPGGRLYEQREATVRVLEGIDGLSFVKNSAAFYLFPRLDKKRFNLSDDKRFASDLLHATGILIVPGSGFEWTGQDHFRIVMLPKPQELTDALEKMGKFLDGYKQK